MPPSNIVNIINRICTQYVEMDVINNQLDMKHMDWNPEPELRQLTD